MRIEFFPAAELELTDAAQSYDGKALGLGEEFLLEVERMVGVLWSCHRSARNLIQSTAACRYVVFPMPSSSDATTASFAW